jgi:hypothetical protein
VGVMPPLGSRNGRALLVFFGGVIVLFAFFAVGAYIGRWPRATPPPAPTATAEAPAPSSERFLVEAAVFDSAEQAEQKVEQLRKIYTSAVARLEPRDRLYHVYVGPYQLDQANAIAAELRDKGLPSATVKPFTLPPSSAT